MSVGFFFVRTKNTATCTSVCLKSDGQVWRLAIIANFVVDHVQERDTYRKTLAPKDFHRRGG